MNNLYEYDENVTKEIRMINSALRRSGLLMDNGQIYNSIFDKYIHNPKVCEPSDINNTAIQEIQDAFIECELFEKKFQILGKLLEHEGNILYHQWKDIINTNKNMKKKLTTCKKILQTYGISELQYNAIMYKINIYKERFERVNKYILPEYIYLSSLKSIDDILKHEGSNLNDTITNLAESGASFEYIIKLINDLDLGGYNERLANYIDMQETKKLSSNENIMKHQIERSCIVAEKRLSRYAKQVRFGISHHSSDYNIDFDRVLELRRAGELFVKVVIATPILSGKNPVYFVNEHFELVPTLHDAYVFKEHDKIGGELEEMIMQKKLVMMDIAFYA